jgi:hypothetical protein
VCPQRRQTALEIGELLTEQAGTASLDRLHEFVDTELRVYFTENMNVIRHNLKLKYFAAELSRDLLNNFLQAVLHPIDQYLTSILRTKYHMVLARVDDVMDALELPIFRHNGIIQHETI